MMLEQKRKNNPPQKSENILGKLLIILGLISSIIFLVWLINPDFAGYRPLYYILIFTFIYKVIRLYYEWGLCFHLSITPKPKITREWNVDVLTTFCAGEPKDMVINTLNAIQKITYPHNSFLCDEADDEELKKVCQELNIIHVTRKIKVDAKAGNINNALNTVANGEICLILDPDHEPFPDFLDEVLPYFEDEKVGFVQVPQVYYNQDNTIIANAAAQQTYQFYGPIMMGLNSLGAVPAIGANCTFRRKALDSIGGHAPGLTEDMHTAMLLHAKAWKSVYNPIVVAKGLVPWNYSGYCLQQTKWSRGSFDLFFKVIPRIMRNLTWKQLIYYVFAPFFYLNGLIALIDFLIPVIALLTGLVPMKISIVSFLVFYLPLLLASFAIRQFNQRWLLEQHERGAFIFGGTLFKATWWASLIGFLYALIDKKVPYIPTPKDNQYETPIKLLIPNFVIILLSLAAIWIGLSDEPDFYMMFMAFLAGINVLVLSLGTVMSMQHLIIFIHEIFNGTFISKGSKTRNWFFTQKQKIFRLFQLATLPFFILITIALINLYKNSKEKQIANIKTGTEIIFVPNIKGYPNGNYSNDANFIYDTFSVDPELLEKVKVFSDKCLTANKIPFYMFSFSKSQLEESSIKGFDSTFVHFFLYLREKYSPVFISTISRDPIPDSMLVRMMNEMAKVANQVSFPNIAWVWQTNSGEKPEGIEKFNNNLAWLLAPKELVNKPLKNKRNFNPDIPLLTIDKGIITVQDPSGYFSTKIDLQTFMEHKPDTTTRSKFPVSNTFKEYVKGVVYNPGQDWRDKVNNQKLTKKTIEMDFKDIKKMGANTVTRFLPSPLTDKVIEEAERNKLNLILGFWFDPKVDYITENFEKNKYEKQVLSFVSKNKDNRTIIAWTLGNQTWSDMKLHFNEPYLSLVRKAYIDMVGQLANKIREIDTLHPIIVMEEQSYQLPSAVYAFSHFSPGIDIIGVNSFYEQNICTLDSTITSITPDKPYLVSGFGPKGYWDPKYNDSIYSLFVREQNSYEKSDMIKQEWQKYIAFNNERNLGGIAYCWRDREQGSQTWFGITDIHGLRKPSWYALQNCYTGNTGNIENSIPRFQIVTPRDFLFPGDYRSVTAATSELEKRDSLYFKWIIQNEESSVKILETPFTKGEFSLTFKIPHKKSDYRVYLYVSDNKGNVITESHPLLIKWN
jgi:cellulose synthase (UDP-forming)